MKTLVANGCEVTVLDHLSSCHRANLDPFPQVRLIEADVRDPVAVHYAIENATVVFHLAASLGNKRSIDDPISDAEINVLGTLRILEAAREHKVRKVVASSSAGIFGELKTLPIREDHPIEPDTPYASTKLCGEKLFFLSLVVAALVSLELTPVIRRLAIVVGAVDQPPRSPFGRWDLSMTIRHKAGGW